MACVHEVSTKISYTDSWENEFVHNKEIFLQRTSPASTNVFLNNRTFPVSTNQFCLSKYVDNGDEWANKLILTDAVWKNLQSWEDAWAGDTFAKTWNWDQPTSHRGKFYTLTHLKSNNQYWSQIKIRLGGPVCCNHSAFPKKGWTAFDPPHSFQETMLQTFWEIFEINN